MQELKQVSSLQRVGLLTLLPALLRQHGADPLAVLAMCGLDAHALDHPESTIPYSAMGLLLHHATEVMRCPHLGLEVGRGARLAHFGQLGLLIRNSPTMRVALQEFATNQHRNAHGSVMYLVEGRQQACFGYAVYQPDVPGLPLIYDAAMMATFSVINELVGANHSPVQEVLFSRSKPSDLTNYHLYLGVKLTFDAEQSAIVLPQTMLDQPIAGADPLIYQEAKTRVLAIWRAGELDTGTPLRRELRILLIRNEVSAGSIASRLGLSYRTLSRQLQALETSFQEMLNEARCEFAQQLLANTRLSIAQIATIVGYTDPAVLTRSFTRWAGVNPSEWKRTYKVHDGRPMVSYRN